MAKKTKSHDGFPKKLFSLLGEGVAEEMNGMNGKQLEALMVDAEEKIDESEKAMADDDEIKSIKEKLKDAREPYTDVIKAQRAKIKYALWCREQGA